VIPFSRFQKSKLVNCHWSMEMKRDLFSFSQSYCSHNWPRKEKCERFSEFREKQKSFFFFREPKMENQEEDEVVLAKVTSEVEDNFEDEGLVSNSTLEKVAAAKKYIENHYNRRMRHIQQRKERYRFCLHIICLFLFLKEEYNLICCRISRNFSFIFFCYLNGVVFREL